MDTLLLTLGLSMAIQAVFFVFAAGLKTDKVTDLSYGLTFVLLAGFLFAESGARGGSSMLLAAMVALWGVRLAGYLLYRILRMGRDARFDGIRERPWSFARFWIFQGIAVWTIMLPVALWFASPGSWSWVKTVGSIVWLAGLVVETVADLQKFWQKSGAPGQARWIETGLWRYSRHPNYFGELLCWWGVFVFVAGDLAGRVWLGLVGPMTITLILLFVTGIPTLEQSANRKYGGKPEYESYRRRTSLLIPRPPHQP